MFRPQNLQTSGPQETCTQHNKSKQKNYLAHLSIKPIPLYSPDNMVRVYRGKLDWFNYAVKETIYFVFPGTFDVGETVYLITQWTVDAPGRTKPNLLYKGQIDTSNVTDDQRSFNFLQTEYYKYAAILTNDETSLTFTMSNVAGTRNTPSVATKMAFETDGSDHVLYIGKYNETPNVVNEHLVLLISPSIKYNSNIGVFWQWTQDASGNTKVPQATIGKITNFQQNGAGIKTDFIAEVDYKFTVSIVGDQTLDAQMKISNSSDDLDTKSPQSLTLFGQTQ